MNVAHVPKQFVRWTLLKIIFFVLKHERLKRTARRCLSHYPVLRYRLRTLAGRQTLAAGANPISHVAASMSVVRENLMHGSAAGLDTECDFLDNQLLKGKHRLSATKGKQTVLEHIEPHPAFLEVMRSIEASGAYVCLDDSHKGRHELDDFMTGVYRVEDHGNGPVRWIGDEATGHVYICGETLHITAAGVFENRDVRLTINGQEVGQMSFGKETATVAVPIGAWHDQQVVLKIQPFGTFSPFERGISGDTRRLGLLLKELHFT